MAQNKLNPDTGGTWTGGMDGGGCNPQLHRRILNQHSETNNVKCEMTDIIQLLCRSLSLVDLEKPKHPGCDRDLDAAAPALITTEETADPVTSRAQLSIMKPGVSFLASNN